MMHLLKFVLMLALAGAFLLGIPGYFIIASAHSHRIAKKHEAWVVYAGAFVLGAAILFGFKLVDQNLP